MLNRDATSEIAFSIAFHGYHCSDAVFWPRQNFVVITIFFSFRMVLLLPSPLSLKFTALDRPWQFHSGVRLYVISKCYDFITLVISGFFFLFFNLLYFAPIFIRPYFWPMFRSRLGIPVFSFYGDCWLWADASRYQCHAAFIGCYSL